MTRRTSMRTNRIISIVGSLAFVGTFSGCQDDKTVESALEYRLAIPTRVEIDFLSWIVYVDGIDSTVLEDVAEFICD